MQHCRLAKLFERLIRADNIFEIVGEVILGLVCFRMIASDEMNQELLTKFANFLIAIAILFIIKSNEVQGKDVFGKKLKV